MTTTTTIDKLLKRIVRFDNMSRSERLRKWGRGWAWERTNASQELVDLVGEAEASRLLATLPMTLKRPCDLIPVHTNTGFNYHERT